MVGLQEIYQDLPINNNMAAMKVSHSVLRFAVESTGTFALVFVAAGAVMVEEISDGLLTPLGVALGPGVVIMAVIYTGGHISGAHINPAVTFGFALTRRFSWREVPVYWCAQLGGAIFASGVLRILLGLVDGMGGHTPSGSAVQSLGIEIVLTFLLMFVVVAVSINQERIGDFSGLAIGGVVIFGILFGGPISGGSMNPARSFGPAFVGSTWTGHWVYWFGPLLGSPLGAFAYLALMKISNKQRR